MSSPPKGAKRLGIKSPWGGGPVNELTGCCHLLPEERTWVYFLIRNEVMVVMVAVCFGDDDVMTC